MKENGWFKILQSDSDPAFSSEMIAVLMRVAGVKEGGIQHVKSALGSHCRRVERCIAVLRKVMYQAEKYGDCTSGMDFEIYIASAQIEANQVAVMHGSTVFERTRGVKALSSEELMTIKVMPETELVKAVKGLKAPEVQMLGLLRQRCDAIMAERRLQQGRRAEYSYSSRVAAEAAKNVPDMSAYDGVEVGDIVSYKGDRYELLEAVPEGVFPPVKVLLRLQLSPELGDKWVDFNQIRPLAVDRDPLLLPRQDLLLLTGIMPNDVIAYADCDLNTSLGVVRSVSGSVIRVHTLDGRRNKKITWLPVWRQESTGKVDRWVAEKPGWSAVEADVDGKDLVTVVQLQKDFTLSDDSKKYLEGIGMEADLKAHA